MAVSFVLSEKEKQQQQKSRAISNWKLSRSTFLWEAAYKRYMKEIAATFSEHFIVQVPTLQLLNVYFIMFLLPAQRSILTSDNFLIKEYRDGLKSGP